MRIVYLSYMPHIICMVDMGQLHFMHHATTNEISSYFWILGMVETRLWKDNFPKGCILTQAIWKKILTTNNLKEKTWFLNNLYLYEGDEKPRARTWNF